MSWSGSRAARGGEGFLVRGDRFLVPAAQGAGRGGLAAQRGGGAGRTSWVPVSQAQASEMTSRGDPDRSTGPEVPGSSGSAIVALTRATTCPPASRIALISS
jgi:hypothetical protein